MPCRVPELTIAMIVAEDAVADEDDAVADEDDVIANEDNSIEFDSPVDQPTQPMHRVHQVQQPVRRNLIFEFNLYATNNEDLDIEDERPASLVQQFSMMV